MTITNQPQGFTFMPAGAKIDERAAAREFEALLIARLLKTARQAGEALGTAETQTGAEGYTELAEEHVARVMAQRGAFGISQILLKNMGDSNSVPVAGEAVGVAVEGWPAKRPDGSARSGHPRGRGAPLENNPTVRVRFSPQPSIRTMKENS